MADKSQTEHGRLSPISLSTSHWKTRDRFDAWQEDVSRCLTGMEVRSEDRPNFPSVSEATNTSVELGATVANPNGRTIARYFVGAPRTTTVSLRLKV